jgi:hypothetical protein
LQLDKFAKSHEKKLQDHINIEASNFSTWTISPDDCSGRNRLNYVRFEVFTAVTMKNGVFWYKSHTA